MERQHFLADLLKQEFGSFGSEPWPDDAQLFEPHENEQSLLYEFADCISVRALLSMCQLPFTVQMRTNAEHMSPSGEVPLLKAGKLCVSSFGTIVSLVERKDASLSDALSPLELADMNAAMSLVTTNLKNAEMYVCWCHDPVVREVTLKRYGSANSWPLNWLLPRIKCRKMKQRLALMGWAEKSVRDVMECVAKTCDALSVKLGSKNYFCFDDRPTELDALVFGHLFTMLTTELPDVDLASVVKSYKNLLEFCQRIEREYFTARRSR